MQKTKAAISFSTAVAILTEKLGKEVPIPKGPPHDQVCSSLTLVYSPSNQGPETNALGQGDDFAG